MKNHSKIFKFLLSILLISCISSLDANAQNKKISLQGFLKDANGKAVADGIQVLTFKIYTVASGGPVLWSEDQSIPVVGGVYAVQLGKVVDMSILNWQDYNLCNYLFIRYLQLVFSHFFCIRSCFH